MSKRRKNTPPASDTLRDRIFEAAGITAAVKELVARGKPPKVRAFTEAEQRAARAKFHAFKADAMAALKRRWKESNGTDLQALLGALFFCQIELPEWLFTALTRKLIEPMPQEPSLHWGRWLLVCEGKAKGLSLRKAQEYAHQRLAGTPYAGRPRDGCGNTATTGRLGTRRRSAGGIG